MSNNTDNHSTPNNDSINIIFDKYNGYCVVFTFISIGILLLIYPNYFGNALISNIVRWIFIAIGLLGFFTELSKAKTHKSIKGIDDLTIGIFIIGIWAFCFYYINNSIVNIVAFIVLIIGLYGTYCGILKIYLSYKSRLQNNQTTKKSITNDLILFLTRILGLILVFLQLIRAL